MNLVDALGILQGDVIAFTGAGGKTTAMFQLAKELASTDWRVITTTTTFVSQDELRFAPQRVGFGHGMRLPDSLPEQLDQHRHIFVFAKLESNSRVRGVRPQWLDNNLASAGYLDVLLVEADSAGRMSLKAPKPDEPSVPQTATLVVPVVGVDVVGKPLHVNHVYGADVIHQATGYPLGEPVTPQLVASILVSPQLGLKNTPPEARIMPILNKVDDSNIEIAREIARLALTDHHIDRVLVSEVQQTANPVQELHKRVGVIVLAAGESVRMGEPKMLMAWKNHTIIREVCQRLADAQPYEIVVVAGQYQSEIKEALEGLPVRIVYNPEYETSDLTVSLQIGLRTIWYTSDVAMVALGDQPMIDPDVIERVMQAYAQGSPGIVAPTYDEQRGHPLMIDRNLWADFVTLPPDRMPREVIAQFADELLLIPTQSPTVIQDIDTPEAYQEALRKFGQ